MAIITISRRSHSGGTLLANELGSRLGWRVLSQEDVSAAAAETYRMTEKELFQGLYLPANFFQRFTHQKERYLLATQATITQLLPEGNGIYHGLAGQFLFAEVCNAFRVRLVAPMEYRIDTAVQALGVSRADAVKTLQDNDAHRARWSRQIFGVDITDPALYDLVVNLEHVSIEAAAEMITEIMDRDDYQPTPECLNEYRDFSLDRRVRAELRFNSPFYREGLEIRVQDGEVVLSGGKSFEAQRDSLVRFVGRIDGVEKVTTDRGTVDRIEVTERALATGDATASDVMLKPQRYPNCRVDCTIREAIVALGASAVKLDDGHIMIPRYVLVLDDDDRLVGVVSRRELLKGLIPHLLQDKASEAHIKEFVPFAGDIASEPAIRWTSLFSKAALDAAEQPIHLVMVPIKGTVQVDDTLSTVISTMLYHGIDLVPVLDGEKVAGVVLMTNIFDFVAQFVLERGSRAQAASGKDGDHG
jgi:cytidylate kinase